MLWDIMSAKKSVQHQSSQHKIEAFILTRNGCKAEALSFKSLNNRFSFDTFTDPIITSSKERK